MREFSAEEGFCFGDVKQRLSAHGVVLLKLNGSILSPATGLAEEVWLLDNKNYPNNEKSAAICPVGDEEILEADVIRSLCARLGVTGEAFGWTFADDEFSQAASGG